MQLPSAGRCRQVTNLALATAARRRASTQSSGRSRSTLRLAPCALGEQRWRGKVTGKGGWGLMQNTDWVVCTWVGSETEEAFCSKASTVPKLPALNSPAFALQRHKPAHNCFCVNRRPFHAVVNPQAPTKSAAVWRGRQMHTAGIDPQTEGGAGAGHLRLSLCPGQTRSFWGTRTSCVSTQKPVSLTADDDCRLQDYD